MKATISIYIIIILVFLLFGCHSHDVNNTGYSRPEQPYLSKNWKMKLSSSIGDNISQRVNIVRSNDDRLIAFITDEEGLHQSNSFDYGKSWSDPELIFPYGGNVTPVHVNGKLLGVLTVDKVTVGGQIYFHPRQDNGWGEAGSIRDTYWGDFNDLSFAVDSSGNIYCAWADWRKGNSDIYFSVSNDGGKTWNTNIRIDDDESGQEQSKPKILSTPGGVLYILWEDNRNPATLFDIYFSSSQNGGRTWSPNIKVNDDTARAWQITPSVVWDTKNKLYAVWADYRDRGASGDVTSNIYFSRYEHNRDKWSQNIRITDAQYGQNLQPRLHIEPDGLLYCIWMNSEENQQNDIYLSHSKDEGRSWSRPARVNDTLELVSHDHRRSGWLGYDREGEGIIGWSDWRTGEPEIYFARTLNQPDPARPERVPQKISVHSGSPHIHLISGEQSDTLFSDTFCGGPSSTWDVQSGIWVYKDQKYIGYGSREASNFVGSESWTDYMVQGRFKLDRINHQSAIIYIRVNKDANDIHRYYRIYNYFRRGVQVEYFDGNALLPVTDRPFHFQKDQWYTFRVMVKENVLNYYVDDTLLVISDDVIHLPNGHIGIGTEYYPTYFKDIVVTSIE